MENDFKQDPVVATSNSRSIYIEILLIVLILSLIVGFFIYTNYFKGVVNNETKGLVSNRLVNIDSSLTQNSSYENIQKAIADLDDLMKEPTLTDIDRQRLKLRQAYLSVVNRSDGLDLSVVEEARKNFKIIYESTESDTTLEGETLNDNALFGFVFSFVNNCFPYRIILSLPEKVGDKYFLPWRNREWQNESIEWKTKEAFKGFIRIVDSDAEFEIFKNDKSFNSYSAFIKAMYLDSYKDEMSPDEISQLVASIEKDFTEYEHGKYISIGPDSMRITMSAVLHFAFAKYAINQATSNSDDYTPFEEAYTTISTIQNDSVGKALVSSWLKIYELGAMYRGNADATVVKRVVSDFAEIVAKNPEISPTIVGYLMHSLADYGKWVDIKLDFFKLANESVELANLLDSIGLKNYKN